MQFKHIIILLVLMNTVNTLIDLKIESTFIQKLLDGLLRQTSGWIIII